MQSAKFAGNLMVLTFSTLGENSKWTMKSFSYPLFIHFSTGRISYIQGQRTTALELY